MKIPVFKEIDLSVVGKPIAAPDVTPVIFGSANGAGVNNFEKDFTAFVYKDKDGAWPGYVFALTSDGEKAFAATAVKVANFTMNAYLSDPGAPKSADFKDGLKPSQAFDFVKYIQFSKPGASFNLGVFTLSSKKYLLISASYDGFKEAVKNLGL